MVNPLSALKASADGAKAAQSTEKTKQNQDPLGGLTEDFDKFLSLLTTQLKNQDPMDPVDTAEFTNQLVMYAEVGQLIKQNTKLDTLIANQEQNIQADATQYMGRLVETATSESILYRGKALWNYDLGKAANSVKISVVNPATGEVIRTIEGETSKGKHQVSWDGSRSTIKLPEGKYQAQIVAKDSNGNVVGGVVGLNTPEAALADNRAVWKYSLSQDVDTVEVSIISSTTNRLVKKLSGDVTSGSHTVNWDGTRSATTMPDGSYEVEMVGKDASGNVVPNAVTLAKADADLTAGEAEWDYTVNNNVASVEIFVKDPSNSKKVYSVYGKTGLGNHKFEWDGMRTEGVTMPDGRYILQVQAKDSAGENVYAPISGFGVVSAVDYHKDGPRVLVFGKKIPISQIDSIGG